MTQHTLVFRLFGLSLLLAINGLSLLKYCSSVNVCLTLVLSYKTFYLQNLFTNAMSQRIYLYQTCLIFARKGPSLPLWSSSLEVGSLPSSTLGHVLKKTFYPHNKYICINVISQCVCETILSKSNICDQGPLLFRVELLFNGRLLALL